MKKFIPILIIIAIVGYLLFIRNQSGDKTKEVDNPLNNLLEKEIIVGEDICAEFPKEFVEKATGKTILKTEKQDSGPTHICQYFVNDTSFLTLRMNALSVANQKTGSESMGRTLSTNPKIQMEHFIATQENGLINGVYLIINPNLFIVVDRSSAKAATETEIVDFAIQVADRIQNSENQGSESTPTKKSGENIVPLPQEKDIINNFFELIKEGRASDAVMMMSSTITKDDSIKQAFGVQFAAMKSVKIIAVEESMKDDWTEARHQYKVTFNVVMDQSSANKPIPYYGYENGSNIRFLGLIKEDGKWKIEGLATGP